MKRILKSCAELINKIEMVNLNFYLEELPNPSVNLNSFLFKISDVTCSFCEKTKIILYLLKILQAIYFYVENNKNLSEKNYYVYCLVLRAKTKTFREKKKCIGANKLKMIEQEKVLKNNESLNICLIFNVSTIYIWNLSEFCDRFTTYLRKIYFTLVCLQLG